MLKRKITRAFKEWLAAPKRKALLVTGARQTGKTFAIREFAKDNFDNVVEVNFIENQMAASLLGGAKSSEEFIERLSLLAQKPISQGRVLVFLDEIQAADDVLTLSKFLVEPDRFDLILSGSLLGVELNNVRSFPVGYLREVRVFPLDFEEFCWSQNVPDSLLAHIRACYRDKTPLDQTLHEQLVQLYRRYIVVGGMPEAVQTYLDTSRDLAATRAVHEDILNLYRKDISQYAKDRTLCIQAIYDSLPSELAKVNKRFTLQKVKRGSTYESLKDDFLWLDKAGVTLKTCLVTEPTFPLARTMEQRKFKLYSADTGMLVTRCPQQTAMAVLQGSQHVNYGAVYENVIAQELAAARFTLGYYSNNRKGELDFLLETHEGRVIPLEVKSGKDYKLHTALNNVMETKEYAIDCAYVLSEHNVSVKERKGKPVYYLPLYMSMCFATEQDAGLQHVKLEELSFDNWK